MIANIPGCGRRRAGRRARSREPAAAAARRERRTSASPRPRGELRADRRTRTRSPSRARSPRSRAFADGASPLRASPARRCAGRDGSWQPSRRSFPTVGGTLVRRTPLRLLFPPLRDAARALPARRAARPSRSQADTMLGAFLLMRRTMLDEIGGWDAGYRHVLRGHRPQLPRGAGRLGALVRAGRGRARTSTRR